VEIYSRKFDYRKTQAKVNTHKKIKMAAAASSSFWQKKARPKSERCN
jgi:hypothetical protein